MGSARLRGMHRPAPAGADLIGLVGPAGGNHSRYHNPQFATGATTTPVGACSNFRSRATFRTEPPLSSNQLERGGLAIHRGPAEAGRRRGPGVSSC